MIKKPIYKRITSLLLFVVFVFCILLISIILSGGLLYFLVITDVLPPLSEKRLPAFLMFLLLASLFIGTVLAIIGGKRFLTPLRELVDATKEVTAGNFNVKVDSGGPRELNRLADNFNEMTAELAGYEKLRNDFIGNISHEFKTPIVSIRGFARRLKKVTLTEQQREEYLDIIIAETERLTRLSSNVMLLAQLESEDKLFESSSYFLDEQIRRAVVLLEPQFEKKHLELEIDDLEPMRILANEEALSHIWINLLENAIKFSPQGGTVEVSLKSDGEYASVSIADHGVGMDEEVKRNIFDKFYQSDESRITEGSGLGLSLVKRILQLCGGEITVESTLGEGSCFTVLLPKNF